jgi:hypothetical protein
MKQAEDLKDRKFDPGFGNLQGDPSPPYDPETFFQDEFIFRGLTEPKQF